jgi:CRISPR-associated protein Csb1
MSAALRELYDVELEPVAGSRFQPTGFPDIGAGEFERPVRQPDGTVTFVNALIVESPQSIANRLEGTAWDAATDQPAEPFAALPYVRVVAADDGRYLTSSRVEAHRLASAFVKDSTLGKTPMRDEIRQRLGLRDDTPVAPRDIAKAVFALDPFCLLHGVFFAESAKVWPGQPRIARAMTGFVEAVDVRRAEFGGVKRDHVRHAHAEGGGSTEGYGTIPYHRTEYTAGQIIGSFSIDLGQLRAYGLDQNATDLLHAIAQWELRTLLDGGLRFRTACDLAVSADRIVERNGAELPDADTLSARVTDLAGRCQFDPAGPIEVRWTAPKGKAKAETDAVE